MKEIYVTHKIILRALIKRCGGSALSVAMTDRYLLRADFVEALLRLCPKTPHIFYRHID